MCSRLERGAVDTRTGSIESSTNHRQRPCYMTFRLISSTLAAAGIFLAAESSLFAWQMKQAPLMSDFAQQVNTNNPLPEYPRPQLVRSNWMNLNGIWQFQPGSTNDPVPSNQTLSSEILVPFPM